MPLSIRPTLIRRMAEGAKSQFSAYKPKKVWPPDFSKLSPKEQFRFEKRYKRRVALATARPRWNQMIQLAQLFSITFVVVYAVLFMEWNTERQPFQEIRDTFWGAFTPEKRYERRTDALPPVQDDKDGK